MRSAQAIFCIGLAVAIPTLAQVTTATFYGVVTDTTGAGVPEAGVTLTDQNTSAIIRKTTDGGGEFVFDFLHVGAYTLQIEAKGFKMFVARAA